MSRRRVKYWKRTGDPLVDDLVCPRCGANAPMPRRPRGGGIRCDCGDGTCFRAQAGKPDLVWRHSPCPNVVCDRCGWTGTLKAPSFESSYGNARCRVSSSGWHDVRYTVHANVAPAPLTIELVCIECGAVGHVSIDCVSQIAWEPGKPMS
jgi:ribosomal protein L40E